MSEYSTESTTTVPAGTDDRRDGYGDFLAAIAEQGARQVGPLFTTEATGLGDLFLGHIPPFARQHYTCRACVDFIDRYGGLVTLDARGGAQPAIWPDLANVPPFFRRSVEAVLWKVAGAMTTGAFVSDAKVWGLPVTGAWKHLAVPKVAADLIYKRNQVTSASQKAAERLEEFGMLQRALGEYSHAVVAQALIVLRSEALYRSEKVLGVAEWLDRLHSVQSGLSRRERTNVIWRAVADAPAGWCHVRSTMIATLLDDIVAGLPFEDIKRRFGAKMDPTRYQRPIAAPSEGQINQAEKIVAKLGAERSLERRFAVLTDIEPLWLPSRQGPPGAQPVHGGVFGHLRTPRPRVQPVEVPPITMTWEKFRRTVLPSAKRLEYAVPAGGAHNFAALVTAVHADAPVLLQWGNPVSWYVYRGGSHASAWNLDAGDWVPVTALALQPSMWGGDEERFKHHGASVLFLLDGARDVNYRKGAGLFPECLASEFHAIRKTVEAHAGSAVIAGQDDAQACGIRLVRGAGGSAAGWGSCFRVDGALAYKLDRWD